MRLIGPRTMKKRADNHPFEAETLAAYLDGQATNTESRTILGALEDDPELREVLSIARAVDFDLALTHPTAEPLPLTALAASCEESHYCCIECEKRILQQHNIPFEEEELLQLAVRQGWQKEEGRPLHNIGRLVEHYGLTVTRRFGASLQDIMQGLRGGESLIAAVDGGELNGDFRAEAWEDILEGPKPDHTVLILGYDAEQETITLFDPNTPHPTCYYPVVRFLDAWADSQCYLVSAYAHGSKPYMPTPIEVEDVVLSAELNELCETIAENAHEVWAAKRQAEGWTYGPVRNDQRKETPDMVPYASLPESEKQYDRDMAMQTIKLVTKLGYDLVKREK